VRRILAGLPFVSATARTAAFRVTSVAFTETIQMHPDPTSVPKGHISSHDVSRISLRFDESRSYARYLSSRIPLDCYNWSEPIFSPIAPDPSAIVRPSTSISRMHCNTWCRVVCSRRSWRTCTWRETDLERDAERGRENSTAGRNRESDTRDEP